MSECQKELMNAGKPYPKTCPTCGLFGPCGKEGHQVNDYQVGGNHYRSEIQHWDYVERNGLGYLEGCASKYATRNRKKHESPVEDLNKAVHYCKKLQSLHLAGRRNNRRGPLVVPPEEFIAANELNDKEARVIMILTFWEDAGDLEDAIEIIEHMRDSAQAIEEAN